MLVINKTLQRLRLLRWAIPLVLALLVAVYYLFVAPWVQAVFGGRYQLLAEILFYGIGGPLLAFISLDLLIRWLEERETSELQSQILEKTRDHMAASQSLNDEALQTLYAVSILIEPLQAALPENHPETASGLEEAKGAVHRTMTRLRDHLQGPSNSLPISKNAGHPANGRKPA